MRKLFFFLGLHVYSLTTFSQGPYLVHDFVPGIGGTEIECLGDIGNGNLLYAVFPSYPANTKLMQTDGTSAGTKIIGTNLKFKYVARYNHKQVYTTNIPDYPICTINTFDQNLDSIYLPGVKNIHIKGVFNNLLFFEAITDAHGNELWRSDGTQFGTFLIKDVYPGPLNGVNNALIFEANGEVYFEAKTPQHGKEIWRTKGHQGDAKIFKNIGPGSSDYDFNKEPYQDVNYPITVTEKGFYFVANDGAGFEIWYSNGTTNGTLPIGDVFPSSKGFYGASAFVVDNEFYFTTTNRLFRHNASSGKLEYVDLSPLAAPSLSLLSSLYTPVVLDSNTILAFSNKTADTIQVYQLNSDFSGFTLINQQALPTNGTANPSIAFVKQFQSRFIFQFKNGLNSDSCQHMVLYNSKKNQFKIQMNCFINSDVSKNTSEHVFNNKLYYPAFGSQHFYEPACLNLLSDTLERLCPGCQVELVCHSYENGYHYPLYKFGNRYYFPANNAATGNELYSTDFSAQGTGLVKDMYPGFTDGIPYSQYKRLFLNGASTANNLIFVARDIAHGIELFSLSNQAPVLGAMEGLLDETKVSLYPNPCTNELNIISNKPIQLVRVLGLDGGLIMEERFHQIHQNLKVEIDLNRGVYLVMLFTETGVITKKLIVE